VQQAGLVFEDRHTEAQGAEGGGYVATVPTAADDRKREGHGGYL